MTTATYNINDLHRSIIVFYDLAGTTVTDPSTVTFILTKPDGVLVSYTYGVDAELVKDSTGTYYVDITYDQKSRHVIKWTGTGNVQLSESVETYVL